MNIYGLMKMTLLDFPGRVACTVFLGGCNLRCPYCHNYELVTMSVPPVMTEEELFSFLEKRRGLLDGVAVTGGEPCLDPGLPDFLRRIKNAGFPVKLDTNGTKPGMLEGILREGLADYVAMDIKNSPEKYAQTAGLPRMDTASVSESIRLLMESPVPYEFRTTVVDELHEADDFAAIGEWISGAERFFLQPFTDRDTVPFGNLHAPGAEKLRACADAVSPFVRECAIRGAN